MPDQPDVVDAFTQDHREIERLFDLLVRAGDARVQRVLTEQVIAELVRHSVTEEQYLYPAVRERVPDGDALADKQIADHAEIEELLKDLEGMDDASDPRCMAAMGDISAKVRSHLREEEDEVFPLLREHADAEELLTMGTKVERAKKLAPTHPHPSAPDTPPLNKILGPGAGLVDRIRDRLSGRAP
jgi:hemerythrin superfamily protein